jgi:alkylation response protein AidB-like acyl-CoA dehydrogenase
MKFPLTEEQEAFRRAIRAFAEKEIAPIAAERDETNVYPVELLKRMAGLGCLGWKFSSAYGGGDGTIRDVAMMFEELAAASAGITLGVYCHVVLALTVIARIGNDEQKQRYLVPGIRGEKIGAFGSTEAGAGSDIAAISTRATREACPEGTRRGDAYVLNGAKLFCTNSPIADFIVLSAVTDAARAGGGISLFVVERGTPGMSVSKPIRTLGMHPAQTAEVVLENVRVPAENRLGAENRGVPNMLAAFAEGRIIAAAFAVGIARAAFDAARKYALERVQFGQPIAKNQVIAHRLADMDTEIQAARLLTHYAASLGDNGQPFVKEASQAKVFATEAATKIATQAMHIQGAYGYMAESPAQRYCRDTHVLEIGEGTSEILRNVIAKQLGL